MKKDTIFFVLGLFVALPGVAGAATCSRINLTKCLDSACAINLSANPAARCQYCGTAEAGEPATSGMKSVTAGNSAKNTISAKELKDAPDDPGERYVWATKLCLKKVQNCTTDDVEETYDPLIEKSCTAAGVSQTMSNLQKSAATSKKTESSCTSDIQLCITADTKCGKDFSKCADDEKFNQFFAACSAQSAGCTDFTEKSRNTIAKSRTNMIASAKSNLTSIVASHIKARISQVSSVNTGCANDSAYEKCVASACQTNTNDNCVAPVGKPVADGQLIAQYLCQYHKTACAKVKNLSDQEMQKELDKLLDENKGLFN